MTVNNRTSVDRDVERGIRYALVGVFVAGVRDRNPGAVVNAAAALAATFLPDLFERRYDVEFRPWQRVYTQAAMLTHAVGMLGPYEETWWWDHLTHTHSATLLAGLVHAVSRRRGHDPRPRVLGAVVGVGVLWELMEYVIHAVAEHLGFDPVLVPYGRTDTMLDLVFDLVGALVVVAFGDRLLSEFVPDGK